MSIATNFHAAGVAKMRVGMSEESSFIKSGAGVPLSSWPLSRRVMRERLDALRLSADAGRGRFALLALSSMHTWRRWQTRGKLLAVVRHADAWGWLPGGRLGVIFCQQLDEPPDMLAERCTAFRARLAALTEVVAVDLHEYPLVPRRGGSERQPLVVEGEIDRYFILPTPWWKRAIDALAAAVGLIFLSPLLAVVAIVVKLTSPGPILYRQQRTGQGGRTFSMYKFRSMIDGAHALQDDLRYLNEQDGPAFKIHCDPRVTRLGWWMRKTCIDELPQLWNVLRGDMSLVGPRPLPCRESAACFGWRRRRLDVTPGITCFWQINGRSLVSFDRWMQQDIEYVQQRSFWLDLLILFSTLPAILSSKQQQSTPSECKQVEAKAEPS